AMEWKADDSISEGGTLESPQRWLPRLDAIARSSGALIAPGGGAKVYMTFPQGEPSGLLKGISKLGRLQDRLSGPPAMALACGDIVSSGLNLGPTRSPVITGRPIFHNERLLSEALPGQLLISPPAYKQLKDVLRNAGGGTTVIEGVRSQKKFYALSPWPTVESSTQTVVSSGDTAIADGPVLASIRPGSILGERYEILKHLGAGAMGTVFKARDRKLDDVVALKMLPPEVLADAENLERMKSEIRIARKITHPNVLRTHDLWEQDGQPVISMEYVRGIALSQLIERSGKLKLAAGLRVCSQVLKGLAAAHQAGVLHRDIKPANIILDQSGNARLMDFGISHPTSASTEGEPHRIMGTANYMAPEIVTGGEVDERSDLYAMGVMMFEIFTGTLPFKEGKAIEVCMAHVKEEAPDPSERWPGIPNDLEKIIQTCMAKSPQQRYASAERLLRQLQNVRRQSAAATAAG
ncbi:MAG: serine/threonine-protein kinase, partial [Pseudomonadota bacterium]